VFSNDFADDAGSTHALVDLGELVPWVSREREPARSIRLKDQIKALSYLAALHEFPVGEVDLWFCQTEGCETCLAAGYITFNDDVKRRSFESV
jgi:hypothetical protein